MSVQGRRDTTQIYSGSLSASFEKQMDPNLDATPYNSVNLELNEELGVDSVDVNGLRLLGTAREKEFVFTSWIFLAALKNFCNKFASFA